MGAEDTTRILDFKVKSNGALLPGMQKLPKLASVCSTHLSEEDAGKALILEDSRAANPWSALFYKTSLNILGLNSKIKSIF